MGGILMSKVNLKALVGRNMISTSDRCNSLLARGARVNIHCFGRDDMRWVEIRLDGLSFYLWCRGMPSFEIEIRHPAFHKVMTSFLIKWLMRTANQPLQMTHIIHQDRFYLATGPQMCLEKVHPADTFHLHPHAEGFHVPGTTSPSIGREKSSLVWLRREIVSKDSVDNSPFRACWRPKNIPMLKIRSIPKKSLGQR